MSVCECKVCSVVHRIQLIVSWMYYHINVIVTYNEKSNSTVSLIIKRIDLVSMCNITLWTVGKLNKSS